MTKHELNTQSIVVGCNYHTTWQGHRNMRFVLAEIRGGRARLRTRTTGKDFWCNLDELIFIMSNHNINKAKTILKSQL